VDYLDATFLARIQFAFTIGFHIVFPALSIGLAAYLAVLEGFWLLTKRAVFLSLYNYWLKAFALIFGMGVVSGVVMSYQFGTNWGPFADMTGPILGPLMGYEVLTAFFLEAGFLGVMLFGMQRVGPGMHYFATLMVAGGTLMSGFWILSVNSWMQTPAGYAINSVGQFVPTDWWAIVFNPSFANRFVHMMLAAYLAPLAWPSHRRSKARVLDGFVDGGCCCSCTGYRRGFARTEYTRASAGESCRNGGALPNETGCPIHSVRYSEHCAATHRFRRRSTLCGKSHSHPLTRW